MTSADKLAEKRKLLEQQSEKLRLLQIMKLNLRLSVFIC